MRTILHIGMSKTGTTALQRSFARSRDYLAASGVLYPRNPPCSNQRNHQVVACGLGPFDKLPREFQSRYGDAGTARASFHAFAALLRAQVGEMKPALLLLSGESMFRALGKVAASTMRGLLEGFGGEVRVVAYVRRPSEHFLSHIQQAMRYSHLPRVVRGREILPVLDSYAALFGSGAIHARPFRRDEMIGGDVIGDFVARHLSELGVTREGLAPPGFANESLSAEASDISRRYRAAFHAQGDRFSRDSKALLGALAVLDVDLGAARPRLRPGLAEALDYASAEPLALRDRYGLEFAGLDYARLARGEMSAPPEGRLPLDRLLEIDRSRECAVLEALRETPWAGRGGRRGWIESELAELGG